MEFNKDNTLTSAPNASSQISSSSFQTTSENTFTITQGTLTDSCRVIDLQDKSFTFKTDRGRKTNTFYIEFTYTLKK